ncbi:MAG: T9SS type A sorting domain-containing protein, partial [Saprospiraceae bacterium]|nr:T9SS type A sorting domain-containing protein [Saprospiraceae bacterium]
AYSDPYNLGNTQITIVLPAGLTYYEGTFPGGGNTGSMFVESTDGGSWVNQDIVENHAGEDFHAVASSGALMNNGNALNAGTEYKLFTVYVFGDCNDNLRLFRNGIDPNSSNMPGGGDFANNFIHQVSGGNFPDEYSTNYDSGTPICLPSLPVELVEFRAEREGTNSAITWVTSIELNNDYFEVQRSADGRVWETIGMVNGAGTTTLTQEYNYTDVAPYLGVNYYRLEQFDLNGNSEFSEVRKVIFDNGQDVLSVKMFPNPTAGQLRISSNQQLDNHRMVISDITGKIFMNNDFVNGSEIDLQNFNPGMYLVRIFNQRGDVVTTQRVIKSAN